MLESKKAYKSKTKKELLTLGVQHSLVIYLKNFSNSSFGIRELSKKTGLHQKTIKRLIKRENYPTHQTLLALYREFYDIENYEELLKKCPPVVAEEIKKCNPGHLQTPQQDKSLSFLKSLKENPIKAEIFVLAGINNISIQAIAYKYGSYGVELLEQMDKEGILKKVDEKNYTLSKQGPKLTPECLQEIGTRLIKRFFKPQNAQAKDHNIISFYAEGLSEAGLKEWLKIDTDAYYKKINILKQKENLGSIPAFTFNITETLLENKNDT